ncbi:MAG: hypothetical protein ABFS30_15810 [Pseudomonadota bacterium]
MAFAVTAAFGAHEAAAAPNGGTITGTVKLAKPSERGATPRRGQGFTERISNPLKPPKAFNPLPNIVVVLSGGTPDPSDTKPGAVEKYRMIGESFSVPLLPVVAGTSVDIYNDSRFERDFYSDDDAITGALAPAVGAGKKRSLKKFNPSGKVVEVRVKGSPHIAGSVVAFEHAYFSRVDNSGKFEIKGVPAGAWKIKVWYRDGWVDMADVKVDVVANKPVAATVSLPAKLKQKAAPEPKKKPEPRKKPKLPPELMALQSDFESSLGMKVNIQKSARQGKVIIHFYSDEELQTIYEAIVRE